MPARRITTAGVAAFLIVGVSAAMGTSLAGAAAPRPPVRDYLRSTSPLRARARAAAVPVRPGDSLPAYVSSAHFKVHFDPAVNSSAYASALLGDLEQAWAKLVAGGGGTPNAGLQAPPSDNGAGGDNLVDAYLVAPTRCGATAVGCTATDSLAGSTSSIDVLNNSGYTADGVAHVAAHEFMHVIEFGYGGGPMMEGASEWAAYWAVPNAIQFMPSTSGWSIDCHDTSSVSCNYDQWTFVERQVEDYGVGFVDTMMRQPGDRSGLRNAIALASAGRDTLSSRYASYARRLWDPSAWQGPVGGALGGLQWGQNFATTLQIGRGAPDSGLQSAQVNQLAARYVRVTDGHAVPTGPADQLRISVGDPAAGIATPTSVLVGGTDGHRTEVQLSATCGAFRCATIPFDQASVADVVVPLVNDNDPHADWGIRNIDGTRQLTAVSCPSTSLCVAADNGGYVLASANPGAGAGAAWASTSIDAGRQITDLSCPSASLCVAVDKPDASGLPGSSGYVVSSTAPAARVWAARKNIDTTGLTGVSCPSTTLCVAVDAGGRVLTSTNPGAGTWSAPTPIATGRSLSGVSCPSTSFCAAVDLGGYVLTSTNPTGGAGAWSTKSIDSQQLTGVSCASSALCAAVDTYGYVLTSANPAAGAGATWAGQRIAGWLGSVACPSSSLCVAAGHGSTFTSLEPADGANARWASVNLDGSRYLLATSCASVSLCVTVDDSGNAFSSTNPASEATPIDGLPFTWRVELLPGPATPPANDSRANPASVGLGQTASTNNAYASGTGAGEDPGCSSLSGSYRGVWYRLRTTSSGVYTFDSSSSDFPAIVAVHRYGSITCGGSTVQATIGSGETVDVYVAHAASATLTGGHAARLLVTAAPLGPPSNLVSPQVSPSGSVPPGATLSCSPGTWNGLPSYSYGWLRDSILIRSANSSSYRTGTGDTGHQIRCRVTAANSRGRTSADTARVSVTNAGGVRIGRVSVKGTSANVPLSCTGARGQSCTITSKLTIKIGRKAVALGSAKVRLVPGRSRTVRLTLNAQGRRLLSQRHTLRPKLTISQMRDGKSRILSTRTITFHSSSRKARTVALNSFGASTFAM